MTRSQGGQQSAYDLILMVRSTSCCSRRACPGRISAMKPRYVGWCSCLGRRDGRSHCLRPACWPKPAAPHICARKQQQKLER